ncbi:hypothetical protein ACHAXR_003437 [Thalassiosira sp. AJA248-18]
MPTFTKQRIAASSSLALIAALGLLGFIQISELNLPSYYLESDSNPETSDKNSDVQRIAVPSSNNKKQLKKEREQEGVLLHAKEKLTRLSSLHSQISQSRQRSPACHPHFNAVTSDSTWTWSNNTKFKRLYFYHARKAGGTSFADYLVRVAHHHGLEWDQDEWKEAEEPGTHDVPTFYVTHLREPYTHLFIFIARPSHLASCLDKDQGRWNCKDLTKISRKDDAKFVPTELNANKLESWNETMGHVPITCGHSSLFKLGECAVNCYTQWFSGLSCPEYNTSMTEQYHAAKAKLLRYNMIIVLEKLTDPAYAKAIEDFFGVPGVTTRRGAYCERAGRTANKMNPLEIKNETRKRLMDLNEADIGLYNELTDCPDGGDHTSNFPKWDPSRFANVSVKIPYDEHDRWKAERKAEKQRGTQIKITIVSEEEEEEER